MMRLFIAGGPYMIVLSLLAVVVLVLSVQKTVDLFGRGGRDPERLAHGVDAILFWGCISATVGFLGQFTSGYLSLMVIRRSPIVNPALVAEGIAVALLSTVFGLITLSVAGLIWFGLRCRVGRLIAQSATDRTAAS